MQVTFWGVRGSIATPGPRTVRYGGNTVCVEVRTADDTLIILDAGTGIRELGERLVEGPLPRTIHLFVTHPHWDHIMGMPFFAPLWRKDAHLVLHAISPRAQRSVQKLVLFDGEHFPVARKDIPSRFEIGPAGEGPTARLGSATISYTDLNHPGGSDGFRLVDDDGSSFCYLNDNELLPAAAPGLARFAEGAGLLIHDAQYLPADMPAKRGWGHSIVPDVLELGRSAGCGVLALHHHDPSRSDDDLDMIGFDAAAWAKENAHGMAAIVAREGLTVDVRPR